MHHYLPMQKLLSTPTHVSLSQESAAAPNAEQQPNAELQLDLLKMQFNSINMFIEAADFCIDFVTEAKAYYEPIVEMHTNKANDSKTAKADRPKHQKHADNYQAKLDNLSKYNDLEDRKGAAQQQLQTISHELEQLGVDVEQLQAEQQ